MEMLTFFKHLLNGLRRQAPFFPPDFSAPNLQNVIQSFRSDYSFIVMKHSDKTYQYVYQVAAD
jgi:hypothetical protein